MKIGIDISQIIYGTGTSVYTKNLVSKLLEVDQQNTYVLFAGSLRRQSEISKFVKTLSGNFSAKVFPVSPTMADLLWNKLHKINIEKFIGKVDIFHSSDWTQPPTSALSVTTVHDLAPILLPQFTHPKIVEVHKRRLTWVKKEADAIIVPSIATKNDLLKLGFNKEKIHVIYESYDSGFKPSPNQETARVKLKYNLGEFFLTIGANPRKNIDNLIAAFRAVATQDKKLAIVGQPSVKVIDDPQIVFLGHVDQIDLPALYSGSLGLLYPSLYEGFGLPILEAFATKTPVLTSNISSMAEVASDAAILVDPNSVDSISSGIVQLQRSRENLVKKGTKRVGQFSWDKAAHETLQVYARLAKV